MEMGSGARFLAFSIHLYHDRSHSIIYFDKKINLMFNRVKGNKSACLSYRITSAVDRDKMQSTISYTSK